MIPPVDNHILQSNPKFAALYANLTNNILNSDGSTTNHPSQKERAVIQLTLRKAQASSAKDKFLISGLRNLDLSTPPVAKPSKTQPRPPPQPLPSELVELILLLTSRLTATQIPLAHIKLLESTPQWRSLPEHLPYIASLLSTHLQTQASALTRVLSPTTNPSFIHRSIPKLYPSIAALQEEIDTKRLALHKQRSALTTQTTTLLQAYQDAIAITIQLLETSKHGSLSLERHYLTQITYLALEAQKVELEARAKCVKAKKMIYTPEAVEALGRYKENLRDARERLSDRKRSAERILWGYGVGRKEDEGGKEKEKVMREIARVYGELRKEIGEVQRDVERLRGK